MPDLLKISITFCVILFFLKKKVGIGYVMLFAAALLSVFYMMPVVSIVSTVRKTLTSPNTMSLLLALSLIRILEQVLRENNILSEMMEAVKNHIRNRRAIIISMPLLIGMLPSLGGAYFSAPMVKEATSGMRMSREEKAFINYWFRHPWEYVLPLYPGILLASALCNIPLDQFMAANSPYALTIFITGFLFSMRGLDADSASHAIGLPGGIVWRSRLNSFRSFGPIFAILLLVIVFRVELHYTLLIVILPLIIYYRYPSRKILDMIKHGFSLDVIMLIFGIMLFKETMEASGAVRNLSLFFIGQGIPLMPIICLLPFITGLLTGLTVGFIGATFPLLISLAGGASLANMSLAFAAGFLGVLLSPVHLCLVLTREYFMADVWGLYKKILPASALICITAFFEYFLLR